MRNDGSESLFCWQKSDRKWWTRETAFSVPITGVKMDFANCALGFKYFDVPEIWPLACYQTPRQRVVQIFTTVSPSRISSGASPSLRALRGGRIHFFRIKIKLNEAPWREKNGPHEKSPSTFSRRKDITDVTFLLAGIVNLSAPPLSFAVRFYETPTGCSLIEADNFLRFPVCYGTRYLFLHHQTRRVDASVNNWLTFSRDAYNFETCNIYFTLLSG